ncbi:MAG: rhodanese-like domain-containing protein [Thermodesulfobacteriota bacterium]|nr:rhodanese-like domain-containing protein [Thermodesulfobacteriota bacterium]
MSGKDTAKGILIILGLAVIVAFTANFLSPKGIALFGEWDKSQGVVTARAKDDFIVHELEIDNILDAKEIYDKGSAVFVDARARQAYEDGHIKNAISLPVRQFNELIDKFAGQYPTSISIVTYCYGRECEESHELAQYLIDEGYTDVKIFIDGYMCWEAEGYPLE